MYQIRSGGTHLTPIHISFLGKMEYWKFDMLLKCVLKFWIMLNLCNVSDQIWWHSPDKENSYPDKETCDAGKLVHSGTEHRYSVRTLAVTLPLGPQLTANRCPGLHVTNVTTLHSTDPISPYPPPTLIQATRLLFGFVSKLP